MQVNFDPSQLREAINPAFYPLLFDKNRFLVLRGGAGSGKSHFAAQKVLLRIINGLPKYEGDPGTRHRIVCLCKTLPAAKDAIYKLLNDYIGRWGLDPIVHATTAPMKFDFANGFSEIMVKGLDNPDKLRSIEGITSFWLEEATNFTIDDIRQVNLRLRGEFEAYKQIMLSFNPVSKTSWVYERFFQEAVANATLHFSTYKDNRFLDEEYKSELEDYINQDYYYYQVYTLGEWGVLQNLVYTNYKVVESFPEKFDQTVYGLDFGYTGPSALIEINKINKENNNFYVRELFYEPKHTTDKLIRKLEKLIPNKRRTIYSDHDPEKISEIRKAGFRIKGADKTKDSVQNGLDFVRRHKLYIDKKSDNLKTEITSYKYKEDRDGHVFEEPVKKNGHGMDAMRYGIYTHFAKRRIPRIFTLNSFKESNVDEHPKTIS